MYLNEFELLRACNSISRKHGGCLIGEVGSFCYSLSTGEMEIGRTWRRQWLISVELEKDDGDCQIRFGFCQSRIARANRGGFGLFLQADPLSMCARVDDVIDLWECMIGSETQRKEKALDWVARVQRRQQDRGSVFWSMDALVQGMALEYANEERIIR